MSSTRPGDQRTASAADAVDLLQGDEPGVLLVGPSAQTGRAIRMILDRLSDRSVMPIGFAASGATPEMLRQEVAQAHAARSSPDTDLLLVVSQADRLSPDLLHELEMAAEAAATHGGLKFLFAAPRDLSASLQRAELWNLAACVRTRLPVVPPEPSADPPSEQHVAAPPAAQASGRPFPFNLVAEPLGVTRPAQPARPVPRIMLAISILGILGLALTGMLVGHQPVRLVAPTVAPVIAMLPPAATTIRLPAVPDVVPSSPSPDLADTSTATITVVPVPASPAPVVPAPLPAMVPPPELAGSSPAAPATSPRPPAVVPPELAGSAPAASPPPAVVPPPELAGLSPVAPATSPRPPAVVPPELAGSAPAASPPPPAVVPPPELASSSPAAPATSPPPPAGLPPERIDTGQIVPQLAPARHASLLLLAGPADTLPLLYEQVYRGTTPPPYAQVATLNPVVRSGVRLVFPAPPTGWPAASPLP